MKIYNAALVGLGNIAWQFDRFEPPSPVLTHAGAYQKNSRTTLRGGYSPDSRHRRAFEKQFDLPAFASFEQMMSSVEPQIVSICSPVEFHFEQLEYCLRHETPMVWLEKPPAARVEELDLLLKSLLEMGGKSKILVNYQRRYMECYQRLCQVFQNKLLGNCQHIHINYSRGLENNGCHLLDLLFYIVDEKSSYSLDWVSLSAGHENPSFGLTFGAELSVVISGLNLSYHCLDISLICERGRASVLHGGMTPVMEVKTEHENFPSFYRLTNSRENILGTGGFTGCFEKVLEDLISAHEIDREPLSNLRTARPTQFLIETVQKRFGSDFGR